MKIKIALSVATVIAMGNFLNANETTKLDEIQVVTTASGYEQNIADAAASISVITAQEIEKKSYSDITDVLKNVPGVHVNGGGSNQSISIRGMDAEYTLYLIDGKPMQGNDAFSPNGAGKGAQINFLPPLEAIERIEIIRGPASSLYGSNAMGGVINIITKKHADKVTANINTEFIKADSSNKTNDDSYNANVFINIPVVKDLLSFQVKGAYLHSNESNYSTRVNPSQGGSDPDFKRTNTGLKAILTPNDNNTFGLEYNYSLQERRAHEGKSVNRPLTKYDYAKYINYDYNLTHELKYDKFLINSYVKYEKAKNPTLTNDRTGNSIEFDTITLNSQGTYYFDNNSLTVGANYKKENLEDGATNAGNIGGVTDDSIIKMDRYQWALFAEDTWSITDDLALTLSGRYDKNEDFGSEFSPKAYAVYSLTDNLNLKGGVTTGYKAPSVRQSTPNFVALSGGNGPKSGYIGDPNLKPETSINYEAGFTYDNNDLGLNGSLMVFKTDFKDKISSTKVCDSNCTTANGGVYPGGIYEWYNVDKAELKGFEFTTDYYILDNLKYRQSYTYTDSERKSGPSKGEPLNNISKHMFNAGIDWDITNKVMLWTQTNYRSETSGSPERFSAKYPSYTFVDLGGVYNYDKNLKFTAGIYNLTNKEVFTNDVQERVLDGRRYSVAMNLKF
ncbi:TonB-dependent receptor domain-containing protein [Aliarcobacter lanthieri]|uniref:TonB-dependent receptor domain-containing protein n=1 Tax=Aliarcobacter lanthieri TaxID=1355374 RepID=UPI003AA902AA